MSKFIEIKHLKAKDKDIKTVINKIIEDSNSNFVEVYEEQNDD